MNLGKHGRKFLLTVVFLTMAFAVMGASFLLALEGKLAVEWVQIVNMFLMICGATTGAFQVANAWITTKTSGAEPGRAPTPGVTP